jgi:hypothetical protein
MLHQGAIRLLPAIVGTVFLWSPPVAAAQVEAKERAESTANMGKRPGRLFAISIVPIVRKRYASPI